MSASPHDALFRFTFGQPEHAVPLLRAILPPRVATGLDWSEVRLIEGTMADHRLRRRQTDLLFVVRATTSRREIFVHVLVEHSSRIWRWMVLRMLAYSVEIWQHWLRQHPKAKRLPRIVPVVVHHGQRGWWAATEFAEVLDPSEPDGVHWQQPRFRYITCCVAGAASRVLEGMALSPLGQLTLVVLQFVPGAGAARLATLLALWGRLVRRVLNGPSGDEAMMALSEYILTTTQVATASLIEMVANEVGRRASKIMETTATRLRREGRQEGRQEGRVEERCWLLGRLLAARFGPLPATVERRIAAASQETVERWIAWLFDAKTLDEVFGDDSPGL